MKILVGYDGSKGDDKILELALQQAKANNASVEILHVADLQPKNRSDLSEREKIDKDLLRAAALFENEGIPCTTTLKIGLSPGEFILEASENGGADMIVIGAHKKSRLGKFLFGSTLQLVILEAPCPVLIWKEN
ncbi:MAG: universal stress protein [Desulfobacterales bacterium]|nr:universal stress protein [Desulfobacterales bacterium]